MSLKDRNAAYENSRSRQNVVTRGELFDINVLRGGVPAEVAAGGVLKPGGVELNTMRGGIPAPWPSYGDDPVSEPQTPHCTEITKKGNPCKAAPIKGTYLCIGHTRSDVSGT